MHIDIVIDHLYCNFTIHFKTISSNIDHFLIKPFSVPEFLVAFAYIATHLFRLPVSKLRQRQQERGKMYTLAPLIVHVAQ